VRWRGSFEAAVHDVNDDAFEISPDLFSWNSNCLYALFVCPSVASLVVGRIVAEVVRYSVHFNRNSGGFAEEVEHERPEWMLSPEV